jgi:two-component system LytT family response regulator
MQAIIIDDVAQAIATLKADLQDYCPEVEVIATADGVISGAKLLKEKTPDVLFLDIQMQDGTGFDLLEILPEIKFKIIFTTASDAFAIRAFKFSAVDYLLKPIDPEELIAAVAKLKDAQNTPKEKLELLADNMRQNSGPKRISLHTQEKIHIINVADIIRCESTGNYTNFFLAGNRKLLVTKTLKEFDKLLEEFNFIRVHQSHLINFRQIKEFVKIDGGYIVMHDGSKIPVSVRKRPYVVKLLEEL